MKEMIPGVLNKSEEHDFKSWKDCKGAKVFDKLEAHKWNSCPNWFWSIEAVIERRDQRNDIQKWLSESQSHYL